MKLIVGLGNPGEQYATTRHNLGFMVVEALAREGSGTWERFDARTLVSKNSNERGGALLVKPQTFMNESGRSVADAMSYFKVGLPDLTVVHDDIDLAFGQCKLALGSSSAGHRGVQSIIERLGGQGFWRLRLGVGRPPGHVPPEDYVLQPFTPDEVRGLPHLIAQAAQVIRTTLAATPSKTTP